MKDYKDIKNELGVSSATIHNWVKTGVIPVCPEKGFDDADFVHLIDKIKNTEKRLRQGTNRSEKHEISNSSVISASIKDHLIIKQIRKLKKEQQLTHDDIIFVIALILLQRKNLVLNKIRGAKIVVKSTNSGFTRFLKEWMKLCKTDLPELYKKLLVLDFPEEFVDYPGFVYESIRTVSEKSITGAFFTPSVLTKDINIAPDLKVLDPCSGTGTILLNSLSRNHDPSRVFLRDIDELALRIAKVNFALFFESTEHTINTKKLDITEISSAKGKFDVIISNPPYGAKFNESDKKRIRKEFPKLKSTESYSIALHQSLKILKPEGSLYFVLPESILFVSAHSGIRKEIFGGHKSVFIKYYGKAFKGVMSPIIRLDIQKTGNQRKSVNGKSVSDFSHLNIKRNDYKPPYVFSQEDMDKLAKILEVKAFYLKGKIKTGLGIVTGNNSKHLLGFDKNKYRKLPIYTGKELKAFRFSDSRYFIDFQPDNLQQVAKTEQYQSPKICYRFIANRPITAYDENGKLVLNSINFFEILDKEINPKALSAFLNSDIVAFIYRSMFNSTKVLKSHLESIPVPVVFLENMDKLESLYERGESGEDVQKELNDLCHNLYESKNCN